MSFKKVSSGLLEDMKKIENAPLSHWEGGMEIRGIDRNDAGLDILRKYILNWQNQDSFSKFRKKEYLSKDVKTFSNTLHNLVLEKYFGKQNYPIGNGDELNAQDYYFLFEKADCFREQKIYNVLDFGAGYARTVNYLLCLPNTQINYFAIDGVMSSYMAQYFYLQGVAEIQNLSFNEFYLAQKVVFKGLNHLPTWQMRTLENESIDLVLCNQVLPELNETVINFALQEITRILKKGGKLYIRDHGLSWMPGHQFNVEYILSDLGFTKTYEYFAEDQIDIHGIPRVFTKIDTSISVHCIPQKNIKTSKLQYIDGRLNAIQLYDKVDNKRRYHFEVECEACYKSYSFIQSIFSQYVHKECPYCHQKMRFDFERFSRKLYLTIQKKLQEMILKQIPVYLVGCKDEEYLKKELTTFDIDYKAINFYKFLDSSPKKIGSNYLGIGYIESYEEKNFDDIQDNVVFLIPALLDEEASLAIEKRLLEKNISKKVILHINRFSIYNFDGTLHDY